MTRGVILVAGGHGLRMGNPLPKQFIPIKGKPVLMHTLEVFHSWNAHATLVITLPESHQAYWKMLCHELNCHVPHAIATGGATRFESVRNSLPYISDCRVAGIHDGVRPLVTSTVIEACYVAAEKHGAAIPVVSLTESIRMRSRTGNHAVDRTQHCIVQTPQVFLQEWLAEAYHQPYNPAFTDDASVIEASGKTIFLVPGNPENIKITTPTDLIVAEHLLTAP